MKRGRFSEEQIVGILKEHEAGRKMAELGREVFMRPVLDCTESAED